MANKWFDSVDEEWLKLLGEFFTEDNWKKQAKPLKQDKNAGGKFNKTKVGNLLFEILQESRGVDPEFVVSEMDSVKLGLGRLAYSICNHNVLSGNLPTRYADKRKFRESIKYDIQLMKKYDQIGVKHQDRTDEVFRQLEGGSKAKKKEERKKRRQLRAGLFFLLRQAYRPLCVWDNKSEECYCVQWKGSTSGHGACMRKFKNVVLWRGEGRTPGEIGHVGGFFSKYDSIRSDVLGREPYALTSGLWKDTSPYRVFKPWEIDIELKPLQYNTQLNTTGALSGYDKKRLYSGDYLYFRSNAQDACLDTVVSVTPDLIVSKKQLKGCQDYKNRWDKRGGLKENGIENCAQLNSVFPLKASSKKRKANIKNLGDVDIADGEAFYDLSFVYYV